MAFLISPQNLSWPKLSSLLSQPIESPAFQQLLVANRLWNEDIWQPVNIGLAASTAQTPVDTKKIDLIGICGVQLQAKTANLLDGFAGLGLQFVFSGVTYFAKGEMDAVQFEGILPCALTFSDSDSVAEKKVSLPIKAGGETTDKAYFSRSWNCDNYILHAIFLSASSQLRRVICYLP